MLGPGRCCERADALTAGCGFPSLTHPFLQPAWRRGSSSLPKSRRGRVNPDTVVRGPWGKRPVLCSVPRCRASAVRWWRDLRDEGSPWCRGGRSGGALGCRLSSQGSWCLLTASACCMGWRQRRDSLLGPRARELELNPSGIRFLHG